MKSQVLPSTFRYWPFAAWLLAVYLFSSSASALVMRENGPEPIIVQIKESLRQSDDLDNRLSQLAATHSQNGLSVVKWWAGRRLLVMLSFPANFSEQRALSVIERLEQLPAIEKVVAASAYNLEFKREDFERAYGANETIPDVARRGFDGKRFNRPAYVPPDEDALTRVPHLANRLIVRWKDEHVWRAEQSGFLQRIADFHRATGCRVVRELRESPTRLSHIVEFDDPNTLADKLRRYMNSGLVEYAQPEFIYHAATAAPTPNDPIYNAFPGPQWGLPLISAPQAWGLTTGDHSVIIAVADTGAPVNGPPAFPAATPHPDLVQNLWSGQNTIVPGENRNFYGNNNDVTDDWNPYYHGTHVASIIGARGNNLLCMSGVAWNVSLMILKVMGSSGNFAPPFSPPEVVRDAFSSSVSGAIDYASAYHAAAINCSFGGTYFNDAGINVYDPTVTKSMDAARQNGVGGMLIVAAAGNAGGTNDSNGYNTTPTNIPLDNVIAVGATDINDQRAPYSSYGIYRVDLGAPGGTDGGITIIGLKPTFNGNSLDPVNYNSAFGTSFAAPHVSGAVALVKSKYPWETYLGVRDRILMGVDHGPQFDNYFRTKGRLNVFKALHRRTLIRNLSTRAFVEGGDHVLIGGFIVAGTTDDPSIPSPDPLKVCVRGLGPSVGVSPVLQNPKIQIFRSSGKSVGSNDDWATDVNASQLAGYNLQPTDVHEAAMIRDLAPGAYTVVVSASAGTSYGIGLVEIYELSGGTSERSRLVNLSTRCLVGTGSNQAIAGTIVGDPVDDSALPDRRILMLGRGPSLSDFGIVDPLPNPLIELHNGSGALMDSNDSWTTIDGPIVPFFNSTRIFSGNALEEELVAAGFFQCISGTDHCQYTTAAMSESALWPTLRSGSYTTVLRDASGSTGVGLIEFYEY